MGVRPSRGLTVGASVVAIAAAGVAGQLGAPEPTYAQVVTAPDPTGDGTTPAVDIVDYTAAVTNNVIGGSARVQSFDPLITGQARFTIYVDISGDATEEFRLERRPVDGSLWVYRGTSSDDVVCTSYASPASSAGIEMLAPASCFGNPAAAKLTFYISNISYGYDYTAPTSSLSPAAGDPTWQATPYVTPTPTPTSTPTATNTPIPTSPSPSAPPPTTTPAAAAPSRMVAPRLRLRGRSIVVRWRAPDANGSTIRRFLVELDPGRIRRVSAVSRRTVFTRLEPGRYRVRVAAKNGVGRSPYSRWVSVRVPR